MPSDHPVVGIVMGSDSDWPTMRRASDILTEFDVPHEYRVASAHRTPDLISTYAGEAEQRGLRAIIAGAGGAAHLAGVVAAYTVVPVIGVPIQSKALNGIDSLLSIVQMPGGIPVATMAIGDAGATNAGLFVVAMLAGTDQRLAEALHDYRRAKADKIRQIELER